MNNIMPKIKGGIMRKYVASFTLLIAVFMFSAAAWAAPEVEIKIKTEKEKVVTKDGQKVKKMIATKNFIPGEIIHYTILYRNKGTEDATKAVINDPIPAGCVYIPGSATETGELTFSIDGGKTYNKPALLTYEVEATGGGMEKRTASPEEYTNIRWVIDSIPAGTNGKVSFQVKVK
jgi:uncharacterized repeat protein (TIGR01451 family)